MATDRVYGALFEIAEPEKKKLDAAEGLGNGYRKECVEIHTPDGQVSAIAYVATLKESGIRPYRWYEGFVVAGAVEHCLPGDYVEWVRTVESKEDSDLESRAKNEALLFAG